MKVSSRLLTLCFPIVATLIISAFTPSAPAAPAPSKVTAKGPVLDAEDRKVIAQLTQVLHNRIKKPNGDNIDLLIVPTARASEGYFSQIRMSAAPAQLKKKLRVTQFVLNARNVRIDVPALWNLKKVRTLAAQTQLRAIITEDDLTQMLARGKHTKTMDLRIKFMGDKMAVTGNIDYALINGPVSGVGQLRMMPGHKVDLDILSMKLRGVELPAFVKSQFASRINPIIDYQDLPFNPPFKGVKVVGNKAYLST